MSKILVVGASGFIGFPLYNLLRKKNEVTGTYTSNQKKGLAKLDITKKNEVLNFLRADDPEIVIHLAAETDVDLCEREKRGKRKSKIKKNKKKKKNIKKKKKKKKKKNHFVVRTSTPYSFAQRSK